jgi:hypothetical protein
LNLLPKAAASFAITFAAPCECAFLRPAIVIISTLQPRTITLLESKPAPSWCYAGSCAGYWAAAFVPAIPARAAVVTVPTLAKLQQFFSFGETTSRDDFIGRDGSTIVVIVSRTEATNRIEGTARQGHDDLYD